MNSIVYATPSKCSVRGYESRRRSSRVRAFHTPPNPIEQELQDQHDLKLFYEMNEEEEEEEANKNENNELLPTPACSALCGNNATGNLEVSDKTSLPMCDVCREKIDPDHKWLFIPFR
jgi:hypothetical protein